MINKSPCIGICQLDENKICLGCKRTIEEIMEAFNASRRNN
tara:strand:- start:275 stop:397 length:123 start_codon:yes stop_codon:yes gene_type:complete